MNMHTENVLVFPRPILDQIGVFQGIRFDYEKYINQIFIQGNIKFYPREDAERDTSFKQIIPYVLISHGGRLLRYIRGKKVAESRLKEKASIGIGGHINIFDETLFHNEKTRIMDIYNTAVERELSEEIIIESKYTQKIVGVINDDSDEVGKVHFGIVHLLILNEGNVRKKEGSITQLTFMEPMEILNDPNIVLENWSEICLRNIQNINGGLK